LLALKSEELGEPWGEIAKLISDRDYTAAINKLNSHAKFISEPEHLAEVYYRIGFINHQYKHDYNQALKAYQQVIDLRKRVKSTSVLEPYIALSRMSVADIYRRMGQYDDAISIYRGMMADYPNTRFAEVALRDIEGIKTALTQIEEKRRIIEKYPNTEFAAEAQFEIAELYSPIESLNNPQQAIKEYKYLVEKYPNSRRTAEAQLKIGNVYRSLLNNPEEAISAYEELVRGNTTVSKLNAEALFRIGRTYYSDLHNYRKALDTFNKLMEEYPTYWKFPAALYWNGMSQEQLGYYDDAVNSFQMFVCIYPGDDPVLLADIGKFGERNIKELITAKIEDLKSLAPKIRWDEAEKLRSEKKYVEALAFYREIMGRYPDSEYSDRAKNRADGLTALAEIQICNDKAKRNPDEASASQYCIAEVYEIEIQDHQRAIREYEKLVSNYPNTHWAADALYRMGLIYSGMNFSEMDGSGDKPKTRGNTEIDYDKAIEKYDQLIKQYPNTYNAAKAHYQIGEIHRTHLRNYNRAIESYKKVVKDYPRQNIYKGDGYINSLADKAKFMIGKVYLENLKNYDAALETFSEFQKEFPDSCRKAAVQYFIASIHERKRENKLASQTFESIIDIIVDSDIQFSFLIQEAFGEIENQKSNLRGFELQRDIMKQIRTKISSLQQ
jgi:tetratricopeptide (TPR) repeat protein